MRVLFILYQTTRKHRTAVVVSIYGLVYTRSTFFFRRFPPQTRRGRHTRLRDDTHILSRAPHSEQLGRRRRSAPSSQQHEPRIYRYSRARSIRPKPPFFRLFEINDNYNIRLINNEVALYIQIEATFSPTRVILPRQYCKRK